jgi:thiol:disulfide interchange protein
MKHIAVASLGLCWLFAGCEGQPPVQEKPPAADESGLEQTMAPDIVLAPAQGEVAELVEQELARSPERTVLVYVSASWCEPCVHLERAIESGQLRHDFPGLRLFKFDFDRDEARLAQAGYVSSLIPLLVVPEPDGRAGERRMEGSIKGPEAVAANLVPRLRQLLAL